MKNAIRKVIVLISIFLPINIFCQNYFEINLLITDTVVVIKKNTQHVVKINAEIFVQNLQDTLLLYYFNKYIPPAHFVSDFNIDIYKKRSNGLMYIIEDESNHIISPMFVFESYVKAKDEIKSIDSRIYISSKQKIIYKQLDEKEQRVYDLAKHEIYGEKQSLELYPILDYHLGTFSSFYNLPKGEYYLYFVYAYNSAPPTIISDNCKQFENKIFTCNFVSNKVKLIVK